MSFLGIDVGSVSLKFVSLQGDELRGKVYLKNTGLIPTVKRGLDSLSLNGNIQAVGITGSGKEFVQSMVGADIVDSEIIAHMVACLKEYPDARTIVDIGGEDSKLMIIKDGMLSSFQMNKDCVLPDDKVIIEGFIPKQIKDIIVGDNVLTHQGQFRKVSKVIKRQHNNLIYRIDCGGSNKLNTTEKHPIFVLKRKQIQCYESKTRGIQACNPLRKCYKSCRKGRQLNFHPTFLTPDGISKGDYLILTTPNLHCSDNSFSPDFLRFLGYYLAEGNIEYNFPRIKKDGGEKRDRGIKYECGVALCFNVAEEEYINDAVTILRSIGLNPKYKPCHHHRGIIKVYSSEFARRIKSFCGEYSDRKGLSSELLMLDKHLLMNLIIGIFRGDGCLTVNNRKRSLVLKTVSEVLASQVTYILLSNHIKATITLENPKNKKKVYMVNVNGAEINKIDERMQVASKRKRAPMECDYGYLIPVRSNKKEYYAGEVYNLAIEGDNTYVCNHLAVHNCGGGTGAMIETIASRLEVRIEDVGAIALKSKNPAALPGKCGIFCQSAAVSQISKGRAVEDILMGVCKALVGNYLAVLAKGKKLLPPIVFQGATALNTALVKCFEDALGYPILVPKNCSFMGAIGIAELAKEGGNGKSNFRGSNTIINSEYQPEITYCDHCENHCELLSLYADGKLIARSGSRCGKNNL